MKRPIAELLLRGKREADNAKRDLERRRVSLAEFASGFCFSGVPSPFLSRCSCLCFALCLQLHTFLFSFLSQLGGQLGGQHGTEHLVRITANEMSMLEKGLLLMQWIHKVRVF